MYVFIKTGNTAAITLAPAKYNTLTPTPIISQPVFKLPLQQVPSNCHKFYELGMNIMLQLANLYVYS
jgi:hypothetical protein